MEVTYNGYIKHPSFSIFLFLILLFFEFLIQVNLVWSSETSYLLICANLLEVAGRVG